MTEYIMSVVAVSLLAALASFFSYGGASERAVRAAISMIMIYTVCIPAVRLISEISPDDFHIETSVDVDIGAGEYLNVAREAFCEGVEKFVVEKFNLNNEDVFVSAYGFDFDLMKAEKIKIVLCGKGVFADVERIRESVVDTGLGDCEVNIKIG